MYWHIYNTPKKVEQTDDKGSASFNVGVKRNNGVQHRYRRRIVFTVFC